MNKATVKTRTKMKDHPLSLFKESETLPFDFPVATGLTSTTKVGCSLDEHNIRYIWVAMAAAVGHTSDNISGDRRADGGEDIRMETIVRLWW